MSNPRTTKFGEVRIIGGKCRSRKIRFPSSQGLRPTPNRIRETLFNWLAPSIQGACCLDLFAGSGALSFEALSRGAKYCLMFDASNEIVHWLLENQINLGFENMKVSCATFPYSTDLIKQTFDIIFIDPPFQRGLVTKVIAWLLECQCLSKGALIYIESESEANVIDLPSNWLLLKDKITGNVRYSLVQVQN